MVQYYLLSWAKDLSKCLRGARLEFERSGVTISGGVILGRRSMASTGRPARLERAATAALVPEDGPPVVGPGPNVCVN